MVSPFRTSPPPTGAVDLSELVPDSIVRTSKPLGWLGLNADLRRLARGGMGARRGNSEHLLAVQIRRCVPAVQQFGDKVHRTMIAPGDLTLLPAGTPWRWEWEDAHDAMDVRLDPSFVARVAERCEMDDHRLFDQPVFQFRDPWLSSALEGVRDELLRGDAAARVYVESIATSIVVHLLRRFASTDRAGRPSRRGLSPSVLNRVLRLIDERIEERLDLLDLADAAHLSPFHFARQFKQSTGLSPHAFVMRRRVDRARELLTSRSPISLAAIAQRCGFCDQSHMTRQFRRTLGITPAECRV